MCIRDSLRTIMRLLDWQERLQWKVRSWGGKTRPALWTPIEAVSYTHLDVYKRQAVNSARRLATTTRVVNNACSETFAECFTTFVFNKNYKIMNM